jgi:hypothetical protein
MQAVIIKRQFCNYTALIQTKIEFMFHRSFAVRQKCRTHYTMKTMPNTNTHINIQLLQLFTDIL